MGRSEATVGGRGATGRECGGGRVRRVGSRRGARGQLSVWCEGGGGGGGWRSAELERRSLARGEGLGLARRRAGQSSSPRSSSSPHSNHERASRSSLCSHTAQAHLAPPTSQSRIASASQNLLRAARPSPSVSTLPYPAPATRRVHLQHLMLTLALHPQPRLRPPLARVDLDPPRRAHTRRRLVVPAPASSQPEPQARRHRRPDLDPHPARGRRPRRRPQGPSSSRPPRAAPARPFSRPVGCCWLDRP